MFSKILYSSTAHENESLVNALGKSQAVIKFDMSGIILWANENFLTAMGYTLDEIKGRHHSMFVEKGHENSQEYKDFWDRLRQGKFESREYKRVGKGGKEIWIQASYNPLYDKSGKPYCVVKYATDITERTLTSADHKGQIDAIGKSQAVIHFDMDGTILWANGNFLSAVGYSLDEIQGKHHRIFMDPAESEQPTYKQFWEKLGRGEFQSNEYRRIGKGGKEIWIQASYNPIFDPTGKPFKVVKYATDITAQISKRHESERIGGDVDRNLGTIVTSLHAASDRSGSVADAATQASVTVQTIASGAEELSSSIGEIAQSMANSREEVTKAIRETASADSLTQNLNKAAAEMSGIVGIIQDIANQINLLALNATIESARAGEAGKGFAVVASEVKNLAMQVGQATDKISSEITGMQGISQEVVNALSSIKRSVESVQGSVTAVASAIEEQSAVTTEISSNMQTASIACGQVDHGIKEIATSIEESSALAVEGQEMYRRLRAI